MAVHLPHFAMERWLRHAAAQGEDLPDDLPVALAVEGTHGPVIHAANRAAGLAGVHPGARVVDMRALCPDLHVAQADLAGDRAALRRLMFWARRWCPWTALDASDPGSGGLRAGTGGLVLDTTGSDHLWGGEAEMLREIEERLSTLGLSARLAAAPTQGAAWALARFGGVREICGPRDLAARTAPLPVQALRLDPPTVLLLQRLGLKTVGALAAVPRISLARRFSRAPLAANPLLRLDQMTGRLPEPLDCPDDPPRFAVQARLAEPVQDPLPHLPALCEALCATLGQAGFGVRRLALALYRTDGEIARAEVATAQPVRDPAHLLRLFDGRLDRLDPGFGFDLVTLAAAVAERLPPAQRRLDPAGRRTGEDEIDLARLIDRLSARFGARAVQRPAPGQSHLPERREGWRPALADMPSTMPGTPSGAPFGTGRPPRPAQPPGLRQPSRPLGPPDSRTLDTLAPDADGPRAHAPHPHAPHPRAPATHATDPHMPDAFVPDAHAPGAPGVTPGPAPAAPSLPGGPERPLRLFATPEEIRVLYAVPEGPPAQFVWRRITHRVTRFAGPERIAPEWWRDRPGTRLRDYYRIEDHTGRRFWIYREGVLGDGRGPGAPRWFVQGVFG